jgi:hypothetical protein
LKMIIRSRYASTVIGIGSVAEHVLVGGEVYHSSVRPRRRSCPLFAYIKDRIATERGKTSKGLNESDD